MSQAIYSGLTNGQAFNVMQATVQCSQELPKLERWSKQRHCSVGAAIAIFACVSAHLLATTVALFSVWPSLNIGIAVGSMVLLVTWVTARQTERRREYMRALHQGLGQLQDAAKTKPGASAYELIHAMANVSSAIAEYKPGQ